MASALGSIVSQTLEKSEFEVIVVNNGSSDNTEEVIREYEAKYPNFSGVFEARPGLHNGRHAGMLAAKGSVLVFADDDIEAFPSWLESIRESFADEKVAMVGGDNLPQFLESPSDWLKSMWDTVQKNGLKSVSALSIISFPENTYEISPFQVWGCNFSIRKKVLIDAGGFHPDGMPEESIYLRGDGETHVSEYVAQSELKCVYHQGASVYHKVTPGRMTFEYFYKRGFNQGISESYTQLRRGSVDIRYGNPVLLPVLKILRNIRIHIANRSTGVCRALKEMNRGYCDGFIYHQKMYKEREDVRDWVHKARYY